MLTLGISALNFVAISFYKLSLLNAFYDKVETELKLIRENKNQNLPEYFKISNSIINEKNWVLLTPSLNGKFVYINLDHVNKKTKNFALNLFLWETFLIFALTYIFYKLLWHHIREREENRKFLELILLTLSHKLGNFLAIQKLNLEILKQKISSPALDRLNKSYNFIETEFKHTLNIIRNFKARKINVKNIELKTLIELILQQFREILNNKKIILNLKETKLTANQTDLGMIFYLLIENAVKYAEKEIYISLYNEAKNIVLFIKNDINPNVPKGSGIGLTLAKRLGERYKMKLFYDEKDGYFELKCLFPTRKFHDFFTINSIRNK